MRLLILASQSKQRQLLLNAVSVQYEIHPAHIDEKLIRHPNIAEQVLLVAKAKAQSVAETKQTAHILAADSTVLCEGKILEKPETIDEAREMLLFMSGSKITAYTGVVMLDASADTQRTAVIEPTGVMRSLSTAEINYYVTNNPVLTWAGGFSPAYPAGANLLATISGSPTGFAFGFPMEIVIEWLREEGYVG